MNPTVNQSDAPTVLIWVAGQSLALILAACRVPLWAQAPAAMEFLAPHVLITVQILLAAMLFPRLVSDRRATIMASVCTCPFTILAGMLSASPASRIVAGGAYVSGWILVLGMICPPLSPTKKSYLLSAMLILWCAGGPVLFFLGAEYSQAPLSPLGQGSWFIAGPVLSAYEIVRSNSPTFNLFLPLIVMAVTVGLLRLALKFRQGVLFGKKV